MESGVVYLCSTCNEHIDEADIQSQTHPCWQEGNIGDTVAVVYENNVDESFIPSNIVRLIDDSEATQILNAESENVPITVQYAVDYRTDSGESGYTRNLIDQTKCNDLSGSNETTNGFGQIEYAVVERTDEDQSSGAILVEYDQNDVVGRKQESSVLEQPLISGPYKSRRGEWSPEDTFLLIHACTRVCRLGKRTNSRNYWNKVMHELSEHGIFSRHETQTKLRKLRTIFKSVQENGESWQYYDAMLQLISAEDDVPSQDFLSDEDHVTSSEPIPLDGDRNCLQRWTIKESRHLIEVYTKHLPGIVTQQGRKKIPWSLIMAGLDEDIRKRFDLRQVAIKMRNLINKYKRIIKGANRSSHWPLFLDMAKLAEQGSFSLEDYTDMDAVVPVGYESQPEKGPIRWNAEQTRELLALYKVQMRQLHDVAFSETERSELWDRIASQVNTLRYFKISGDDAKKEISRIREALRSHSLKFCQNEAKDVMAEEENLFGSSDQECDEIDQSSSNTENFEMTSQPSRKIQAIKLEDRRDTLPAWFKNYSNDAARRHNEKIDIQNKIIDVLENILTQK